MSEIDESRTTLPTKSTLTCRHCQRTFHKPEHVRRHERSHTGVKPFSCTICKRKFARQDVLSRHLKIHLKESEERNVPVCLASPRAATSNGIHQVVDAPLPLETSFDTSQISSTAYSGPIDPNIDFDTRLIWPDSEELLQSIMSSDPNAWSLSVGVLPLTRPGSPTTMDSVGMDTFPDNTPPEGGHEAVQKLSQLIANVSSSVTAEAESSRINSVFLDSALHMFFTQFIPVFPVLHRATFVFRECTHPLLLNAIALGSLFLGSQDAVAQGEALWRLAHTAVATSWQTLMKHRGPYDSCQGIQLVLTAVLGQLYAMLSKNRSLRLTSQIFHSLGFYWARHCGMYAMRDYPQDVPSIDASNDEKIHKWRSWAAKEIQLRALLAHYILDGQIAQFSGDPTSTRHLSNPLRLPCTDIAFDAATPDDWIRAMQDPGERTSFREIFCSTFSESLGPLTRISSTFTLQVVLEGLKSLILERLEADGPVIGLPSKNEVNQALIRLYHHIHLSKDFSPIDKSEAMLRWHVICLDFASDSSRLCKRLCRHFGVKQHILGGRRVAGESPNFVTWLNSTEARQALMHAAEIQDIAATLPLGRAHAIHVPSSVFSAATVYAAFVLFGAATITIPRIIDWPSALQFAGEPSAALGRTALSSEAQETLAFLLGNYQASDGSANLRNILYDLSSLKILLRGLSIRWGVAAEMVTVLDSWISNCH